MAMAQPGGGDVQGVRGVQHDHALYTSGQQILIIGSSLVKHVNRHVTQSTHVVCVPGGSIGDVKEELVKIGSGKIAEYSKMVIQVGSNDLADQSKPSLPESEKKTTIDIAKEIEELIQWVHRNGQLEVVVSGLLPRVNDEEYCREMAALNGMLSAACKQPKTTFVDNVARFVLQSGDIDDSVYEDDVHLGIQGTLRLIRGWGVPLKQTAKEKPDQLTLCNTIKCKPDQPWVLVEKIIEGIPMDIRENVIQIEKKSSGVWLITMDSPTAYSNLVEKGVIVEGKVVRCYDVGQKVNPRKRITLSEVPFQVTDDWLQSLLSGYGSIDSITRRCHDGTTILNGKVDVEMSVDINIPKVLKVASNVTIGVEYMGQREDCKNCGSIGHFTSRCPKPRPCYICKKSDHKAVDCPQAKTCYKCGLKGHLIRSCRQGVVRADAVKTDQSKVEKDKPISAVKDKMASAADVVVAESRENSEISEMESEDEEGEAAMDSSTKAVMDNSENVRLSDKRGREDSINSGNQSEFQTSTPKKFKKKKKKKN